MKKMMTMAFAAAMSMMMSVNAMAAITAPSNDAEMATAEAIASTNNTFETRSMLSIFGDKMFKFDYVLDAEGTIVSKTKYMKISDTNDWTPVCTFRAAYGEDSNKLFYSEWNEADKAFNAKPITVTFTKEECPVMMRLPEIINY